MATAVKQALQPEIEGMFLSIWSGGANTLLVIHVILSVEAGVAEIPRILRGEALAPGGGQQIGTQNYSRGREAAVVLGGGYNDAMFDELRNAANKDSQVPWLRLDRDKPGPRPGEPGYQERVVEGVQACLKRLKVEGKLAVDGVHSY